MADETGREATSESEEEAPPEIGDETAEQFAGLMLDVYEGEGELREHFSIDDPTWVYALDQAYQLYANGKYERAERLARGLVALDESAAYPNVLLGDILFQQGPGVSTYANEEIDDPEVGTTYKLSRTEEAIRAFERAQQLDGDDEFVQTRLAELYLRDGWQEGAVELLEQLADDSDDPDTRQWAETVLEVSC